MTRFRLLFVAGLAAATFAVPASAQAGEVAANPCNHRTPRPPAGTVCFHGVWAHVAVPVVRSWDGLWWGARVAPLTLWWTDLP